MIAGRVPVLATERLILRRWRPSDREPFAAMNADPRVMEFFPQSLSRPESDASADRIEAHFTRHGFGLYAVERRGGPAFIGFIGLSVPNFDAPFMPCVEIGWRLASRQWGQGLATEGAREVVRHAFDDLGMDALVSFATAANLPSRRVMAKLGMRRDPAGDFEHPAFPPGHPLRRHVLYRLQRNDWEPEKPG